MKLIDAAELYEKTAEWEAQALHMVEITMNDEDKTEWRKWSAILGERSAFKFDVADAPTVDAVPVIRCKDCKYWQLEHYVGGQGMSCQMDNSDDVCLTEPTHFCSWAERKEE